MSLSPPPLPAAEPGRWISRLIVAAARFTRPMTLGVRALVIDAEERVLLVRHTYVPGFFLPGGGAECGETLEESLARELVEEGNVRLTAPAPLFGLYFNRRVSRRDHVALYIVRDFTQDAPRLPDYEIAEAGFFARDALPEGTTPATRARLAEYFDGAPVSPYW
jgi:ADP-ribose pyrophosphatase YjhB (NUDIX family)